MVRGIKVTKARKRLEELGIKVQETELSGMVKVSQTGNLVYLSGHGCELPEGGLLYTGKIGEDLTIEQGYEAARYVGVNLLATLQSHIGDLNKVVRIVKVLGFVACTPEFAKQHLVMHGFSDLMVQVFGERGQHARSAIGTNALPNNLPVEIEMIVEVES